MSGVVVVGAGPGLGAAAARRFAREGLPVALIARGRHVVDLADALNREGRSALPLRADSTDAPALHAALDAAVAAHGLPEVLVYNAAIIQQDRPGDLGAEDHLRAWSVNVLGALEAATHLAPAMARRGRGTILVTGGMPRPDARYTSLSLGKAGVRALTRLLDEEYGPAGVHVGTVTVDCHMVPGTDSDPDLVAEHYWTLHRQPPGQWQHEIVHVGSTPV
ncbi:SDR family NAD(P)-dependent oxidoreductase [Streptomyces sp. FH025]|uniref:SDR family NAD(P)-dependent oxidoreductase n=1 Tax=Streptomyces sp. FH025 TaxID=2815937 RepID=UPI001A9CD797|nr:SDR family NAD(P)-dependent oxidoreductase [Streptomyces sp. FH025]MBO1414906.1 SDR family NAD(P)-dependent oxidoreductase [Streptomyces sp. FH025]